MSKTINQWAWERTNTPLARGRVNSQRNVVPDNQERLKSDNWRSVISTMRSVGQWCAKLNLGPAHIEWLWCGKYLWLLQLDFEDESPDNGIVPSQLLRNVDNRKSSQPSAGSPWLKADLTLVSGWKKIDNVKLFVDSTDTQYPPLYYITGDAYKAAVEAGFDMTKEINAITHGRAVCRTDCCAEGVSRLNLPRTNTVTADKIVGFITSTIDDLVGKGAKHNEVCFIMHKFIPALSAAWALAEPGSQVVRIDSLWGVPDGLQYLPHDSFEYDIKLGKILSERRRYKPRFIQETDGGKWEEIAIKRKVARHKSLKEIDIKDIAQKTLIYADKLKKSVLVMWFCGIPEDVRIGRNVPWFRMLPHEGDRSAETRLGPEYKRVEISSLEDLAQAETMSIHQKVFLVLAPSTEFIRDDEHFLDRVVRLAKSKNWPVEIQGSVLAHAFYKLESEGVTTVVADQAKSTRVRGKKVFHKLVRDEIPAKIATGGEEPIIARIAKEEARSALLAKLFEEAIELHDAVSPEDVTLELADLVEVIRSLASATGVNWNDVIETADDKRKKRGSFEQGTVLMETSWSGATPAQVVQGKTIPLKMLAEVKHDVSGVDISYTALMSSAGGIPVKFKDGSSLNIKLTQNGLRIEKLESSTSDFDNQFILNLR